jgi:hypothetical protein
MCDSYGAAESPLVSVRTIVAPGYLASTAASTLSLVSPVNGVSLPRRPPGPPRRPPGRPWSAWTAVAWNEELTSTTSSLPSDVLMWAWYGVLYGPPASVRRTVAPGTLSSAAALTLAATSPESSWRWGRFWGVCDVDFPAAVAIAAPPRPSAPMAATVTADRRMVVASKGAPPVVGMCTDARHSPRESADSRLRPS